MYLREKYNKFRKLVIQINDRNSPESKPHVDPTVINNALMSLNRRYRAFENILRARCLINWSKRKHVALRCDLLTIIDLQACEIKVAWTAKAFDITHF